MNGRRGGSRFYWTRPLVVEAHGDAYEKEDVGSDCGDHQERRVGAFFSLLSWGLAAALGGWLGDLTQERL